MARGTSQILALTFPSIPVRAGGRKCEVCSGRVHRCLLSPSHAACSPVWVSPASRSGGEGGCLSQWAGHALDGPLQDAVKGVLRKQRAGSGPGWSLSRQVCLPGPQPVRPGLQGQLSHQHLTQLSYSEVRTLRPEPPAYTSTPPSIPYAWAWPPRLFSSLWFLPG